MSKQRMSDLSDEDWLDRKLKSKQLTREILAEAYETRSVNAMALHFHMDRKDMMRILRLLSLSKNGSKQAGLKNQERAAEQRNRREQSLRELDYQEVKSHIERYGVPDAKKLFGKDEISLFIQSHKEIAIPHSSTIRMNREDDMLESLREVIKALIDEGNNAIKIANTIKVSLARTKKFIMAEYPVEYRNGHLKRGGENSQIKRLKNKSLNQGNVIYSDNEESSLSLAELQKAIKNDHLEALATNEEFINACLDECLTLKQLAIRFRFTKSDIVQVFANLYDWGHTEEETQLRAGVKKLVDKYPGDVFSISQKVVKHFHSHRSVPVLYERISFHYIGYVYMVDCNLLKMLIEELRLESTKEVGDLFPHLNYSQLAAFVKKHGLAQHYYQPSIKEKMLRTAQQVMQISSLDELWSISDSMQLQSANALGEITQLSPSFLCKAAKECSYVFSGTYSAPEARVANFLQQSGIAFDPHNRAAISPLEIDFLINQSNTGIEINPTHTHNSTLGYKKGANPKRPTYHQDKYLKSFSKGIQLVQLYDSDLNEKWAYTQRMLLNTLCSDYTIEDLTVIEFDVGTTLEQEMGRYIITHDHPCRGKKNLNIVSLLIAQEQIVGAITSVREIWGQGYQIHTLHNMSLTNDAVSSIAHSISMNGIEYFYTCNDRALPFIASDDSSLRPSLITPPHCHRYSRENGTTLELYDAGMAAWQIKYWW